MLRSAQLRLDRVHLTVERDDLELGRIFAHLVLDVADVIASAANLLSAFSNPRSMRASIFARTSASGLLLCQLFGKGPFVIDRPGPLKDVDGELVMVTRCLR